MKLSAVFFFQRNEFSNDNNDNDNNDNNDNDNDLREGAAGRGVPYHAARLRVRRRHCLRAGWLSGAPRLRSCSLERERESHFSQESSHFHPALLNPTFLELHTKLCVVNGTAGGAI